MCIEKGFNQALDDLFAILRKHQNVDVRIKDVLASENDIRDKLSKVSSVGEADVALSGLREMANVVLDSGIPEAALAFAITYKLVSGISSADENARKDLKITEY